MNDGVRNKIKWKSKMKNCRILNDYKKLHETKRKMNTTGI